MLQVSDKSAAPKIIKAQEECLLTEWQEIYPDVWLLPEVVEETEVVALCGGQVAPSRHFPTIPRPAGPVQRLQQYTVALQPLRPLLGTFWRGLSSRAAIAPLPQPASPRGSRGRGGTRACAFPLCAVPKLCCTRRRNCWSAASNAVQGFAWAWLTAALGFRSHKRYNRSGR
jgi:hypothetical protein